MVRISWFSVEFPFLLVIFLPGIMVMYFGASSMREGLVLALITYVVLFASRFALGGRMALSAGFFYAISVLFVFLSVSYFLNVLLWDDFDSERFLLSVVLLYAVLVVAPIFANDLVSIGEQRFSFLCNSCFWLLCLMGLFAGASFLIGFNPYKKVVAFNEPSHFALVYLPFLFYVALSSGYVGKMICVVLSLAIALSVQNLTLIIGVSILLSVLIGVRWWVISYLVLFAFFFLFYTDLSIYGNYYFERLNLSVDTDNFSVLVYMSGLERAYLSLVSSYGFGLGFQQLGVIGPQGEVMEKIVSLLGERLNYNDGGFLGAKLVSEFGILGLLLLCLYVFNAFKVYLKLRVAHQYSRLEVFFFCVFISFSVELFIRGAGYFTPSAFVFLVSVCFLFFGVPRYRFK